jgi:hypothetical protein
MPSHGVALILPPNYPVHAVQQCECLNVSSFIITKGGEPRHSVPDHELMVVADWAHNSCVRLMSNVLHTGVAVAQNLLSYSSSGVLLNFRSLTNVMVFCALLLLTDYCEDPIDRSCVVR